MNHPDTPKISAGIALKLESRLDSKLLNMLAKLIRRFRMFFQSGIEAGD